MQNRNGNLVTNKQAGYYPFGDYRGTPLSQTLTDRGFTGQRSNNQPATDLGLLYYNARYYVPTIAKFASADTIVPDPAGPQQFNRYAYTLNNPVRFTDLSGHISCDNNHLPGSDQNACANPHYAYPTATGAQKALAQAKKINTLLAFQVEAIANDIVAFPTVVIGNIPKYTKLSQGYIATGTDYLGTVSSFYPHGTITTISKFGRLATAFNWGLPLVNGAIYSVDIEQKYRIGSINNQQRWTEHGTNGLFIAGTGAFGAGISALSASTGSPIGVPVVSTVLGAFDITLAQEMANGMIEGQPFWPAFWQAREATINVYFFWTNTKTVDQWIAQWFK